MSQYADKRAHYTICALDRLAKLRNEISVRLYLQARNDGLSDHDAICEVIAGIDKEVNRALGKSNENYLARPDFRVRSATSKRAGHGAVSYRKAQSMPEQWLRALHMERAPIRTIVREFVSILSQAEKSNRARKSARHSWRGLCDRLACEGYSIPESFRSHLG